MPSCSRRPLRSDMGSVTPRSRGASCRYWWSKRKGLRRLSTHATGGTGPLGCRSGRSCSDSRAATSRLLMRALGVSASSSESDLGSYSSSAFHSSGNSTSSATRLRSSNA
eukprot:scaffold7052_cov254-Pinguiococcus_pyrenoidosus.AAC.88